MKYFKLFFDQWTNGINYDLAPKEYPELICSLFLCEIQSIKLMYFSNNDELKHKLRLWKCQ